MGCNINIAIMVLLVQFVVAEEVLTSKQYESALSTTQQNLQNSRIQIAVEQNRISELKEQIARFEEQKQYFFAKYGVTEKDFIAVEKELSDITQQLENIIKLKTFTGNPDSVFDKFTLKVGTIKSSGISAIKKISNKIDLIELLLNSFVNQYRCNTTPESEMITNSSLQLADSGRILYTVKSNPGSKESLYKIASEYYGNPHMWNDIYMANKSYIDSSFSKVEKKLRIQNKYVEPYDYIIPGQVLVIPVKK